MLQLYDSRSQTLLLGYNATSDSDISTFPYGLYISENDSAIMILSRSNTDYNLTVARNMPGQPLPYSIVMWDCVENSTVTTGGFLESNQTTSSRIREQNDEVKLSYLVVQANFSTLSPNVGDEVTVNITVTDNFGTLVDNASVALTVADQHVLAQDTGNGTYQATFNTSTLCGFYNVTLYTTETPPGHLQGMSSYPLRVGIADLTVTSIEPCKTFVGQDYPASINVTVENHGNLTETFYVTVYANTTVIKKQAAMTLPHGNSTTVTITWNTTGAAKGNYTITATASTVPGETDTTDNTLTDGWIIVTIPGDVDGDRDVDPDDFYLFAGAYGTSPPSNPNCDIDGDGDVDPGDFYIFAGNYGKNV